MKRAIGLLTSSSLAALLLTTGGCASVEPPPEEPLYRDLGSSGGVISGYAFDPEAFLWALQNAPEGFEVPPYLVNIYPNPLASYAMVNGTTVAAWDPLTQAPLEETAQSSGAESGWALARVPGRQGDPFYVWASGGKGITEPPPEVPIPIAPIAAYLPTVNLRPIYTARRTQCGRQEAAVLSTTGILDAVARTIPGTSVSDFLNPQKFGGVAFIWLTAPDPDPSTFMPPGIRAPAGGATISADRGTVTNVVWKAPGTGGAQQSARGFVVDAAAPKLGLVVLRLPPGAAGEPVTIQGVYDSPELGYPPMTRQLVLQPGVINYAVVQLNPEGPNWESQTSFYCEEE